jgi:ribosome-binding factor A
LLKSKKNYKLSIRHKEQSQRQLKVAQTIHSSLAECFRREGKLDYRLYGVPISIVEVNISPDLKVANCFFVPFNTELSISELLEALEESKYVIRNYVTRQVNLKYSPEIRFYYDEGGKNTILVEKLLK